MEPHDDPCHASFLIDIDQLTEGPLWASMARLYQRRFPSLNASPTDLRICTEIRLMPRRALPITQGKVHVTLYAEPSARQGNRAPRDATMFFSRILSRSAILSSNIEGLREFVLEKLPLLETIHTEWRSLTEDDDIGTSE